MSWAVQAQRAWHAQTTDELAHAWVVGIVERTSLGDLSGIALGWLGRQAPALVDDLLEAVNAPPGPDPELPNSAAACARALVRLRDARTAPAEVPRDLAVLQGLLAEAIARNVGPGGEGDLKARNDRLIRIFGALNAEFAQALLAERLERDGRDELTGLPGERAFQEELWRLVAVGAHERRPFSVLELDLDGLRRVNASAGREAGDRLLAEVADAASQEIGAAGRLFRLDGDELAALVPGTVGPAAVELAGRVRAAASETNGRAAPAISVGVASWPTHAGEPAELIERVREATYAAKASGQGVALAEPGLQRS